MRWEAQSVSFDSAPPGSVPLGIPDPVVRTFDTPGFAGMTYYEIRAKSIISRVPEASRVPFRWTINPYRGCSHACTYCLDGGTPVLMADGRSRLIADLRVGDGILGTVAEGVRRRPVSTPITAHWSTVKPAFRLVLSDGRTLIASGDHRFLTDRGWRFVAGSGDQRPSLTVGQYLVSVARSAHQDGDPTVGLIGVVSVAPTGAEQQMFDITTGTGDFIANGVVSHNCFARNTHTYLDLDSGHDFDTKVVVKVNASELLRKELAAPRWAGEHIAMGTNVDCYQRAEGRYGLMRGIIEALRDFANPFSILTKGTLIARDLDLLRQANEVTQVGVSFSIGFIDEELWRSVEPGTPSPRRRLDTVRQFTDAGFPVTVLLAPVLPGLTDTSESIDATVAAIAASGAAGVTPIALHLRPGAREWYSSWLDRTHPELVARYRELYRRGSYAPKAYQEEITDRVRTAARRHGLDRRERSKRRGLPSAAAPSSPEPPAEQLTLL
jgi:DNA repair photolyase